MQILSTPAITLLWLIFAAPESLAAGKPGPMEIPTRTFASARLQDPPPPPVPAPPTAPPKQDPPAPAPSDPARSAQEPVPAQEPEEARATQPPPATDPPPARMDAPRDDEARERSAARIQEEMLRQFERLGEIFSPARILATVLVLILTYFFVKLLTYLLERIASRKTPHASRLRRVIPVLTFAIWFMAGLLVLTGIYGGSTLTILVLAAVLGIAFLFASQPLLRDLVGGVVIVLERPFQIGDRVRIGSFYGEVRKIGLRAFELTSNDGGMVVVPNAEVLRKSVVNANPGTLERQVTAEILLPATIDIEKAKRIAFEAAAVSPYVYSKKPIEVLVDEDFRQSFLTKIIIRTYVLDAQYENELRSDIMELTRKGFQQELRATQGEFS